MDVKFIKAQYNEGDRTMVAWTDEGRVELFYVYSQEEYDDRVTYDNLVEYLRDSVREDEIPEQFDGSYEKWADAFSYSDMASVLFDDSYCCEWSDICLLAGLDPYDDNNAYLEWAASMPESVWNERAAA
jgi:hypothetical protein